MKKLFKTFLVGMVIGALIVSAVWVKFWPDPQEPKTIIVKEPVISGEISGRANIVSPQNDTEESFAVDFKVTVPVEGEVKSENADVFLKGETTVERVNDLLTVDTKFSEVGIKVKYQPPPEPPRKLWSVGAYIVTDFDSVRPGGFVQRDFSLLEFGPVDVVAFGRIEVDYDTRLMAGVQISF